MGGVLSETGPAGGHSEDRLATEYALLLKVWPKGADSLEEDIWFILDERRREQAVKRIRALIDYEAGDADVAKSAERAGVSVPRFYGILRAWRESPSLAAVVPHAKFRRRPAAAQHEESVSVSSGQRMESGKGSLETRRRAKSLVRDALLSAPDATIQRVTRAVASQLGSAAPSMSALRQLVTDERGVLTREALGGPSGFGRRLLIDYSAVSIPMEVDGGVRWAPASFVVDIATQIILGAAIGADVAILPFRAARSATDYLESLRISEAEIQENVLAKVDLVLSSENPVDMLRAMQRAREVDGLTLIPTNPTRVGTMLLEAIGSKLGGLKLMPKYVSNDFAAQRSLRHELAQQSVSKAEAERVLSLEISGHNFLKLRRDVRAAVAVEKIGHVLSDVISVSNFVYSVASI